ncbi:MAG TPA: hypothetical protein VMT00_09555 [Thermoanaerobaculia bacterium]|nr:hypothetical protein [Thermoanaerobaculia bacterium]
MIPFAPFSLAALLTISLTPFVFASGDATASQGAAADAGSQAADSEDVSPHAAIDIRTVATLENRSADGLQVVVHSNGARSLDLEERFMQIVVARLDERGHLENACLDTVESILLFLEGPAVRAVREATTESDR